MAGIPLHITPLSYIWGRGSQYITTDFYLRSTDVVKSKWRFEGASGNTYGCYTSGGADDNFCLYAGSASTNAYIRYNGQVVRDFKAANGTIYNLEHGPDGFFANGDLVTSFNAATFECSAPMYIFMLPNSSSAKVTARCYGLTVYRDGEQVCNFIPARNELTGEVGFYESIGGVFYENAGSGAFSAGPEVNFSVKTLLLKRRRALLGAAKKIDRQPGYDGYNWLYYEVPTAPASVRLFYFKNNIQGNIIVDGVEMSPTENYTFSTPGEHLVKYKDTGAGQERRFNGCTNLVRAYMQGDVASYSNTFLNCTNLREVKFLAPCSVTNGCFTNCSSLPVDFHLDNITSISGASISSWGAQRLFLPDIVSVGSSGTGTFEKTSALKFVDIGPNVTTSTGTTFYRSSCEVLVIRATTPPTGNWVYSWNVAHKIYVPYSADHSILAAYQTASNWSASAAYMYELNQDGTIPE